VFWRPCRCPKRLLNSIRREYYKVWKCVYVISFQVMLLNSKLAELSHYANSAVARSFKETFGS
jgi:hypothetical protein